MRAFNRTLSLILVSLLYSLWVFAETSVIHPGFPMLDSDGKHVRDTGNPISTSKTCGTCHDTDYIEQNNFHSNLGLKEFKYPASQFNKYSWELSTGLFGKWSPLTYRQLSPDNKEGIDLGTPDWVLTYGAMHAGGGPARYSRDGRLLTEVTPVSADNPETSYFDSVSGERKAWNWKESGTIETNCFLCHLSEPDNASRIEEIEKGYFSWANTATLAKTGIVSQKGQRWVWNRNAFEANGNLKKEFITVHEPSTQNCAQCHSMADTAAIEGHSDQVFTSETGVVFAAEQISESHVNVVGKSEKSRSWDIHSQRMMNCTGCHHSINNPAFYKESDRTRPDHLKLDGRKMSIAEYLHRPSHKLANQRIRHEIAHSEPDNVIQNCETCHDPYVGHEFLPYKKRHIWALGCESCHIPKLYSPALQQIDWTTLAADGQPIKEYRGVETSELTSETPITGFEPSWFTRNLADASHLLPYNLVTSWYWAEGEFGKPVQQSILNQVYFEKGKYKPDILQLLDENRDGQLDKKELRLSSREKISSIRAKLVALGIDQPRIESEIRPFSIHHGVTGREEAISDCYQCHGSESRFTKNVVLASFIPPGVTPKLAPTSFIKLEGEMERTESNGLVFKPKQKERGLYLFGRYRNNWVDIIGLLSLLGVVFGIALHGGARIVLNGKLKAKHKVGKVSRVYMYPVYERLWHWLQAATIIMFIFTGLEIHFADKFAILGYELAVRIHEIVAYVFIANALLSIAYHITAGEIKTYIPQPKSFIDESWRQVIFYLKGIFVGADHPIEKTPERRLNPLQQVTYLGILYVLIPIQAITGVLIWGAEIWPNFLMALGGLSVIAPLHTLCAWFFVSFLIMHIYLTTTGHTATANLKSMITGWEDVELKETTSGSYSA